MNSAGQWKRRTVRRLLQRLLALQEAHVQRRIRSSWFKGLGESAARISRESMGGVLKLEDWLQRRPASRQKLLWMLGLDPAPERTPLAPTITGVLERAQYTVEKVVFESLPGLRVTGNLYLPKGRPGPVPCVLYLCGHQVHPLGAKTQYQERFLWYPNHGIACLAIDSLLCGEIQGVHLGTRSLGRWDWLSLGYTPAGIETWNGIRALDYLETRPEINREQIGVTGASGGGVMTWMLSALDERIKVAAPSASAYSVETQVRLRLVSSQCDCTFYPNVFQMDFTELGALIAPRPLLILAGRHDRIFPPAGYRDVYRKLSRLYDLFAGPAGARSLLALAECNNGHADSAESLRRAHEWMAHKLAPGAAEGKAALRAPTPPLERPEDLACLVSIPSDAANFTIHRTFIRAHVPSRPNAIDEWRLRRQALLERIRTTVFNWFPSGAAIPFRTRRLHGSGGHARKFSDFSEWEFATETAERVRAQLFEPKAAAADAPLLVVVNRSCDQVVFPDDELLPLLSDHRVLVLMPRFAQWNPSPAEYAAVERSAALCGRTLAALHVWDTMRTVGWALDAHGFAPRKVSVFGRGTAGIVALYAALFEARIDQVVLQSPPASHLEGPALLTILRTTDVAEVAGAFAPRELTLTTEPPATFNFARDIYRLMDAEMNYRVVASLVSAMRGNRFPARPPATGADRRGEE